MTRALHAIATALLLAAPGCAGRPLERVVGTPAGKLATRETLLADAAPKAELRMIPPEVYMRTYLQLFGGLLPSEVQQKARSHSAMPRRSNDAIISALVCVCRGMSRR